MTPFPHLVVYIGFTLNFFAVMSVASLFWFRRKPGWQKLPLVSFGYPLFPVLFIMVISLAAIVTVATGALFYHAGWKSRTEAPAVKTY